MSTDQVESRYSWKSAIWTTAGCALISLIGWWAGVYKLQEFADDVNQTRKNQTETTKTLNEITSSVDSLHTALATIQEKHRTGTLDMSPELKGRIADLESELLGVKENATRIQDEESLRRTDEAISRANAEELRLVGQDLLNNLVKLEADFKERQRIIESLRTNDDGKRIAASPNHLQRFETLVLVLTPSASDIQKWQQDRTQLVDAG